MIQRYTRRIGCLLLCLALLCPFWQAQGGLRKAHAAQRLKITAFETNISFVSVPVLFPDGKNKLTFSYALSTAAIARIQICVNNIWITVFTAKKADKEGSFAWDGRAGGKKLAPGSYTARLRVDCNSKTYTKKLALKILAKAPVWNVFLSPSTQQGNLGAGDYGTEEARMNQIADVVARELSERGLRIYRNKPAWDVKKCVAYANQRHIQAYVAIHSNAMARKKDGGRASGCEVWTKSKSGAGKALACAVYEKMAALTPVKDRGVKYGDYWETAKTKAPSCIVEVDFHDNPERAKWITENIEKIGIAISQGICRYLNVNY